MRRKLRTTRLGNNRRKPKPSRRRCVIDRLPAEARKPLKTAIKESIADFLSRVDENVRDTFDYEAIELRVVWSFDNSAGHHYQELIVTTEGRKSR